MCLFTHTHTHTHHTHHTHTHTYPIYLSCTHIYMYTGVSIQFFSFFWTSSWTVHEHVQERLKNLEISKYSKQKFELGHEQFMNILDNPWTVHDLRPSAGAVRSTFLPQFFLGGDFKEHGRQGCLHDFRREKQLIHQRYVVQIKVVHDLFMNLFKFNLFKFCSNSVLKLEHVHGQFMNSASCSWMIV